MQKTPSYDDTVSGGGAGASCDSLESLLDIDHKASVDWRNIHPFTILVKDLQSTRVIL